ncbi:MAG TPA: hypothetical protein PKX92_05825 [Edaphocola sp.]|nr:hypothetical protein [Edaphocola sp.]
MNNGTSLQTCAIVFEQREWCHSSFYLQTHDGEKKKETTDDTPTHRGYTRLFRAISDKFDLNGTRILTFKELKRLRIELRKLGIELEVVSRKSPATKSLWEKMALGNNPEGNRVLGFFREQPGFSRKFQMELGGPKMYVLDEVSAYTVAHEMQHARLWHKMHIEFPELKAVYSRISQRVHEEFVLSELLKEGKWNMDDLLKDLKTINNTHGIPEGLSPSNLDYYKEWKLIDQIKPY